MAPNLPRCVKTYPALAALVVAGTVAIASGQEAKLTPSPYASIGAVAYKGPGRASTFDLSSSVIRIGVLAPLHGPEKADGEAIVRAARMALEEASQRAFPGGHRLELAIGDEFGPIVGTDRRRASSPCF